MKNLLNEELVDPAFVESNQAGLQKLYDIIETDYNLLDKKELKNAGLKGSKPDVRTKFARLRDYFSKPE